MTMKKALIASTALIATAGFAAADVTISGYGRTGVVYQENSGNDNDTTVVSRLRMNIDASTSTDQGLEFGARFRLQWDQGDDNTDSNPGLLYVTGSGLTVEVGNVNTAIDSSSLIYATELSYMDNSVGFSGVLPAFYAYAAKDYGGDNNRMGVAAEYVFDTLTVRGSYITADQVNDLPVGTEEEFGLLAEYVWNDRLELSGAATWNGEGIEDNDIFFIGARYAVMDNARIGLNYVSSEDWMKGDTIAIYGDYTLADGRTNIEAYVANNDQDYFGKETDNAFGVGVNYDLGGARLGGSIQRDYDENVRADMGLRFDF
ncbi:porin [Paracoccus saliphilus]|nr:porin [Paracoccus saliphilus]WCR03229.1 porin [Paracoccus saliphilus]